MNLSQPLYRSVLFVPGSEKNRLAKSASIAADALIFDLEDAVSIADKVRARQQVMETLNAPEFIGRELIVRVNAINTPWFLDDVQAVVKSGHATIMLPKCESADDVLRLRGLINNVKTKIFVLIETALGVISVADIAKELTSSDALCFGHVDFAADMTLPELGVNNLMIQQARCQVALAARAYGITPIDHVCIEVKNDAAIREETAAGLSLGYAGKMCIHPQQVDIVNGIYTPSKKQVQRAKAILAAWEQAKGQGEAVFTFDNKMVDLPVIQAQEAIVLRYKAATK